MDCTVPSLSIATMSVDICVLPPDSFTAGYVCVSKVVFVNKSVNPMSFFMYSIFFSHKSNIQNKLNKFHCRRFAEQGNGRNSCCPAACSTKTGTKRSALPHCQPAWIVPWGLGQNCFFPDQYEYGSLQNQVGNLGDFLFNGLDTHQFTMFHSRPWINSYRTYSLWLYNSLLWLNDGPRHSTHGRVLSLGVAELKRKQPNSWNLVGLGLKITLIYSDLNGKQNIKDKMFIHFLNTQ